jgi:6-phosphogluconate dehydrogenase
MCSSDDVPYTVATRSLTFILPQNFALNVAEKGFPISVYNRTYEKTELCVARAKKEGEMPYLRYFINA